MSLFKSTATIAFFTLLSRISGMMRDLLMAQFIGASFLSDAFFVAFKIPNFFRRLFAEGAFNAAFVPSFASRLASGGRKDAVAFAAEVMSVLLIALLVLNAIFILFMPWILPAFAPGFTHDPEKYSLTVTLSRICFPYILFISLVSLLAGMLNSLGKFAAPAAAPILLNGCMILGLLFLRNITPTPAHAVAWGVFGSGVAQLIWLILACVKEGAMPGLVMPKLTQQVKQLLWLMAPAALGSSVQQLNLLVDTIIASTMPQAVSFLYYADRLTELPIGMIGVAVATAILPMMSRQMKEGKMAAASSTMNRALEIVLLFGLPATAALLAIAEPIITVLYQHGQFNAHDTVATYTALMAFAVGLPAFLMVKIFAPGFYAQHDTKTPFKIAMLCVFINLVLNLTLIRFIDHVGMALATSIASWVNVFCLARTLYKRGVFKPDTDLKKRFARMMLASALMVTVLLVMQFTLFRMAGDHRIYQIAALGLMVALGGALYLVTVWFTHGIDRDQIMALVKRKAPPVAPADELEG